MKKMAVAVAAGVALFTLSSCGRTKNLEDDKANIVDSTPGGTDTAGGEGTQKDNIADPGGTSLPDDTLENLTGESDDTPEDSSWQSLSGRIATEISCAEEREKEIEKKQKEADTQMDMNLTAAEMYQLWDDTLNIVWELLEANLNEEDMKVLREEEREWIAYKDEEVRIVGEECGGGSIQPSLEAAKAAELTKARVYELADKTIGAKESNAQTGENIDTEMTTEELLDLFINGSISAISSGNSAFYITDFDMDSGEWDSYSIGERVDLDNDGENELIICGPYGGIYLDARDNKVYEFAVGEGDALVLSYVVYNGSTWIMYSNRMHTGYEAYHMEKFEGADNLVAEMNFHEELVDEDNVEGKEKYTLNGTEISYDEYFELCSKIFATEEITTK